jgi:succinate-semialdehyde dehydrogenase/glutarate-semialdehyde dehydrogenase
MAVQPEAVREGQLRSVDPATLEPVGTVDITPPEAIPELVAEAGLAQHRWGETSHAERRRLLVRVAHVLLDRAEELAGTITAETGKPLLESYVAELFLALEHLRWTAQHFGEVLGAERVRFTQPYLLHKRGRVLYEPLGVVAVVSPWNFPFGIPFTQAIAAIAAGNAVVVKPSELTPLTGAWVERAFERAGAPPGLVRVVQGSGEVGETLVRTRGIAKVFFTGSSAVGRRVAVAAGERLCPVVLELGGKDAMLVFEDADLDRAVQGALWGAFSNCGQSCASVERIYVARALYQPFVEELGRRAAALRIGAGSDLQAELGPLVSEHQRGKVEELVSDALDRGAVAQTGARRPDTGLPGWFYEPTVLTGVAEAASVMREEVFGPVVTVGPFGNEEEAVRLANDSPFGLGASVWTRDPERAGRVGARLEAGTVWTNDVQYSYAAGQAPWGGYKESGFGRTHAKHGLYECSQAKFTDFDRGRVAVPWWYPYGPGALEGFRGLAGVLYGQGLVERAAAAWKHRRGLLELGRRYLSRG